MGIHSEPGLYRKLVELLKLLNIYLNHFPSGGVDTRTCPPDRFVALSGRTCAKTRHYFVAEIL